MTATVALTKDERRTRELIDATRARALASPEFVYKDNLRAAGIKPTCVYVEGDEPSCGVGCGAWDVGLIDASIDQDTNHGGVSSLLSTLDIDADPIQIEWLTEFQGSQDGGDAWGVGLQRADKQARDWAEMDEYDWDRITALTGVDLR